MAGGIHKEENGYYQIDCRAALWSTDKIHDDYHSAGLSILCDVDFVIETEKLIYLVEYKNANIPDAIAHNTSFNPSEQRYVEKIIRKFYDSLHFVAIKGKNKPLKYIYVVEFPNAGATDRKLLRNKIADYLPFKLQKNNARKLIDDFQVFSINEWNHHNELSAFPFLMAQQRAVT